MGNAQVSHVLPLVGRQSLSETSLDSFFPFDPYDLPRAREYIVGFYRNWDEVAVHDEDDDDEDEDDLTETITEDDDDDDEESRFAKSYSQSQSSNHHNYIGIVGRAIRAGNDSKGADGISTSLEGISLSQQRQQYQLSVQPLGMVA